MTSKIASHDNKTNVVLQNLQMYVPLARQGQSMAFVFSPFTFYHLVDELCNNFMSVWYYVSLGIYYVHTEHSTHFMSLRMARLDVDVLVLITSTTYRK